MTNQTNQTMRVEPKGDLTGVAALEMASKINEMTRGATQVVISLANVRTIDASGVAALVRMHGTLSRRGAAMTLKGARPAVADRLKALGLARLWNVEAPRATRQDFQFSGRELSGPYLAIA